MAEIQRDLVLFSGGQSLPDQPFYHYADSWLRDYLKQHSLTPQSLVLFVAWAEWAGHNADAMYAYGREHWEPYGLQPQALHQILRNGQTQAIEAIRSADAAIIVGGGSMHMLLRTAQESGLMPYLREQITYGTPYIGTSAGSVFTCPTLHTAAEPHIFPVESPYCLNIIPFQIRPHYYHGGQPDFHSGPTPTAQIRNYVAFSRDPAPVLGLKDGSLLRVEGSKINFYGEKTARVFGLDGMEYNIPPGGNISGLLDPHSVYYRRQPVIAPSLPGL